MAVSLGRALDASAQDPGFLLRRAPVKRLISESPEFRDFLNRFLPVENPIYQTPSFDQLNHLTRTLRNPGYARLWNETEQRVQRYLDIERRVSLEGPSVRAALTSHRRTLFLSVSDRGAVRFANQLESVWAEGMHYSDGDLVKVLTEAEREIVDRIHALYLNLDLAGDEVRRLKPAEIRRIGQVIGELNAHWDRLKTRFPLTKFSALSDALFVPVVDRGTVLRHQRRAILRLTQPRFEALVKPPGLWGESSAADHRLEHAVYQRFMDDSDEIELWLTIARQETGKRRFGTRD